MPNKTDLRLKYKAMRRELSDPKIAKLSALIADKFFVADIFDSLRDCNYIHVFLSIAKHREVDTGELISRLQDAGKKVIVSSWDVDSGDMTHFLLDDNTEFVEGSFGVPMPVGDLQSIDVKDIDAVLVPLLAFDQNGHRVGYGKGVYDAFLSSCRSDVIKIGVSFFEAEKELIEDVRSGDVRLDICVTPDETYFFLKIKR